MTTLVAASNSLVRTENWLEKLLSENCEKIEIMGEKFLKKKKIIIKKKPTTVQIRRLENIEHKSMKQVSFSGKYSLLASRDIRRIFFFFFFAEKG